MSDRVRDSSRWAGWAGLVLVLVVAVLVATPLLFVLPASDDPVAIRAGGPVDAVVVLGGAPDVRLDAGIELVAGLPEPPPVLVLSVQYAEPLIECGTVPSLPRVGLECFPPDPTTTAGEALWIGRRSAEAGWERVVVVTSDTHVSRARLLVERCVDTLSPSTEVRYLAVDTQVATLRGAWSIVTEWPSLLGAPWDHRPACRP